jgi:hypothetical protein
MCCWGQRTCRKGIDPRDASLFTVLLLHVVAATSPDALQNSDLFALALVTNYSRKYTKISPERIDEHAHKFKHLEVDSRLEIPLKENLRDSRHHRISYLLMRIRLGL